MDRQQHAELITQLDRIANLLTKIAVVLCVIFGYMLVKL